VGLPSPQAPLTALLFSASTLLTSPLARATEAVLPFAFTDCAEAPLGGAALLGALRLESTHLLTDSALRLIEVRYHCDGHAHVRIDTGDEVIARDLFLQDAPLSERTRASPSPSRRRPATSVASPHPAPRRSPRPPSSPRPLPTRRRRPRRPPPPGLPPRMLSSASLSALRWDRARRSSAPWRRTAGSAGPRAARWSPPARRQTSHDSVSARSRP